MVALYLVFAALGVASVRLDAPRMALAATVGCFIAFAYALSHGTAFLPSLIVSFISVACFQLTYVTSIILLAISKRPRGHLASETR